MTADSQESDRAARTLRRALSAALFILSTFGVATWLSLTQDDVLRVRSYGSEASAWYTALLLCPLLLLASVLLALQFERRHWLRALAIAAVGSIVVSAAIAIRTVTLMDPESARGVDSQKVDSRTYVRVTLHPLVMRKQRQVLDPETSWGDDIFIDTLQAFRVDVFVMNYSKTTPMTDGRLRLRMIPRPGGRVSLMADLAATGFYSNRDEATAYAVPASPVMAKTSTDPDQRVKVWLEKEGDYPRAPNLSSERVAGRTLFEWDVPDLDVSEDEDGAHYQLDVELAPYTGSGRRQAIEELVPFRHSP